MHQLYGYEWIETEHGWACVQHVYISADGYYVPYEDARRWCGGIPGEAVTRLRHAPRFTLLPLGDPVEGIAHRVFNLRKIMALSRIRPPKSFQVDGMTYQHYSNAPDDIAYNIEFV